MATWNRIFFSLKWVLHTWRHIPCLFYPFKPSLWVMHPDGSQLPCRSFAKLATFLCDSSESRELLWRCSKLNQAKASDVLHQSYKYFIKTMLPCLVYENVVWGSFESLSLSTASHQAMKPVGLSGKEVKFVQHVCSLWAHVHPSSSHFLPGV